MAHVLFVCLHNAGRSQMSQALFERAADGRHTAASAGTTPAERVHPEVAEVMRELGIELAARHPQLLTRELAGQADVVVTMGCGDECPFIRASATSTGSWKTPRAVRSRRSARHATRSPAASRSCSLTSTAPAASRLADAASTRSAQGIGR